MGVLLRHVVRIANGGLQQVACDGSLAGGAIAAGGAGGAAGGCGVGVGGATRGAKVALVDIAAAGVHALLLAEERRLHGERDDRDHHGQYDPTCQVHARPLLGRLELVLGHGAEQPHQQGGDDNERDHGADAEGAGNR